MSRKKFKGFSEKCRDNIGSLVDKFLGTEPKTIQYLSYEDIIGYFVKIHQQNRKVEKGVVVRQAGKKNMKDLVHLTLTGLDQNLEPVLNEQGQPYLEEFYVADLDEELIEALDEAESLLQFSIK
jgi:hypothetical protein